LIHLGDLVRIRRRSKHEVDGAGCDWSNAASRFEQSTSLDGQQPPELACVAFGNVRSRASAAVLGVEVIEVVYRELHPPRLKLDPGARVHGCFVNGPEC
jgi:hypothetical protein